MLQMLATLLPMDGGSAEIFGVDVKKHPHVVRQLVGVTGQYASVDENLTARENLYLFGRLLGLSTRRSRARPPRSCSAGSASRTPGTSRSPSSPAACGAGSTWPPA